MFNCFCLFLFQPAFAVFNHSEFLKSAWESEAVLLRAKNLEVFGFEHGRDPIESVELKLSKTQNNDEKRESAVRISPRGISEFKVWGDLQKQSNELERIANSQEISGALFERYIMIVEYNGAWEKQKISAKILSLAKREFFMINASTRAAVGTARDLLRSHEALKAAENKLQESQNHLNFQWQKLRSLDPSLTENPDIPEAMPNLEQLEKIVAKCIEETKDTSADQSLTVHIAQAKSIHARKSWKMDQEKSSKIVDYVEVKISEDRKDRVFSFEVGLMLPGSGGDYQSREKARKLVDYEIEFIHTRRTQTLLLAEAQISLKKSFDSYRQIYAKDNQKLQERMRQLAGKQDPMLEVLLENDSAQSKLKNIDIITDVFRNYFSYLNSYDVIVKKPQLNYLSPVWEKL